VQDVLAELVAIWRGGGTAGVGTVVRTFRSAPRRPGAAMVVAPDGTVSGSVSGGCVEGAVYESATEVARTGVARLERYGVSDDDAFAVGLTCGGVLDIFIEPVSRTTFPELDAVLADIAAHRPVALATVIAHPDPFRVGRRLILGPDAMTGTLGSDRTDAAVVDDARGLLAAGRSEVLTYVLTGNAAARAWRYLLPVMPRHPGCWFSAPSTSLPPSPSRDLSWDTGPRCATRAPFSPPRHGSPPPMRWWSNGRTATSPPRPRQGPSMSGP